MISKILDALASFSWDMETGVVSGLLFGEYAYPSESDYEEEEE